MKKIKNTDVSLGNMKNPSQFYESETDSSPKMQQYLI